MKILKGILKTFLAGMATGLMVITLLIGAKTANYINRGFSFKEAVTWVMDEIKEALPEDENPYREKEVDYNINRHVKVVPCVDLT